MRAASGLVLATAFFAAAPARADVDVQYKGGHVDLRATTAPLSEVLDRLARATGMKIVQQGVTPTMLLSLSLQGRTPAEAVFGVLEGLGLNYAFVLDASGNRIETLVLAGASGSSRPASAASSPAAPPVPPTHRYVPQPSTQPPAAGPDESDEAVEEDPAEEPAPDAEEADPAAAKPGAHPSPRGSVLQAPAEPVFPSSPFAPRAPVFSPQPDPTPQAQPQPKPTPPPPDRNQ
jgi:hypothetical protein